MKLLLQMFWLMGAVDAFAPVSPAIPSTASTVLSSSKRDEAVAAMQEAARLREEVAALEKAQPIVVDSKERRAVREAAARAAAVPVPKELTGSLKDSLAGSKYLMHIDIGRESGTWMPPQWGASGARLELDLLLEFGIDGTIPLTQVQSAWLDIDITGGQWAVESLGKGKATTQQSTLRFVLNTGGAARGDVSIPAGQLFFATPAWGAKLSRNKGMVTVKQKRWGFRTESRILGVFSAQRVE